MKDIPINVEPRRLELLAPARDINVGREAILHGADAVYIGASSHGARSAAHNSVRDIAELVQFAHQYRARVYVTVNTIIYPNELQTVHRLVWDLYHAGVDALIVQDMALLEMELPPIELHASTQCDISSVGRAKFLEQVGFSQLVLARELSLREIAKICRNVEVPVECFIHGALCVSYSGRCHASLACGSRSANRGECAQICRLPYTLTDGSGRRLARDKYLLSMHDLNATASLAEMVDAGVSSFKIEGRLKDAEYVKNITAWYRQRLDEIIESSRGTLSRSSYGTSQLTFTPNPAKSFNRGFTDFCMHNTRNKDLVSMLTPKSLGEPIGNISELNNGDGISWRQGNGFTGARVNRVLPGGIVTADHCKVPNGAKIHRTYDVKWQQALAGATAKRRLDVDMVLSDHSLTLIDERGVQAIVPFHHSDEQAHTPQERKAIFSRLGNTIYRLREWKDEIDPMFFISNSTLAALRRKGLDALNIAAEATYTYTYRRKENKEIEYTENHLDFRHNVANDLAEKFYTRHGAKVEERAAETSGQSMTGKCVMTSRHCVLRSLGLCRKEKPNASRPPYILDNGTNRFELKTDCDACEMKLYIF